MDIFSYLLMRKETWKNIFGGSGGLTERWSLNPCEIVLSTEFWRRSLFQFSTNDEAKSTANFTLGVKACQSRHRLGNDNISNNIFFNSSVENLGLAVMIWWLLTSSGEEKKTCPFLGGRERKSSIESGRERN